MLDLDHLLHEPRSVLSLDHLSSRRDLASVLAGAGRLQRAATDAGGVLPLLRGKKLGLLCEDDTTADAQLFRRSAEELGAHVAHIRPSLSDLTTAPEVRHTANMLGRLYDAVECQDLSPALVREVRKGAGIPVYDGVGLQHHPTAILIESLDNSNSAADRRRFVLQAALLQTIAN